MKNTVLQELSEAFRALQARRYAFSWSTVRACLMGQYALPTAVGWDALTQKYMDLGPNHKSVAAALSAAKELYKISVRYGTRAVTTFKVGPANAAALINASRVLIKIDSRFKATFPYPLNGEDLKSAPFNGEIVDRRTSPEGVVRLTACCKRAYRERSEIDVAQLDEDAIKALKGFDQVIGVTCGYVQAFDAIIINPSAGTVEIHIDFSSPSPHSEGDVAVYTKYYATLLNRLIPQPDNQPNLLHRPENLFDRIQKFYDQKDGNVISLAHATGTNSVKVERMRAKGDDLRKEPFHEEGLKAIFSTDIFAISKAWDGEVKSVRPTIDLPGKVSLAGADDARLDYAVIQNCSCVEDFKFAMQKLN